MLRRRSARLSDAIDCTEHHFAHAVRTPLCLCFTILCRFFAVLSLPVHHHASPALCVAYARPPMPMRNNILPSQSGRGVALLSLSKTTTLLQSGHQSHHGSGRLFTLPLHSAMSIAAALLNEANLTGTTRDVDQTLPLRGRQYGAITQQCDTLPKLSGTSPLTGGAMPSPYSPYEAVRCRCFTKFGPLMCTVVLCKILPN